MSRWLTSQEQRAWRAYLAATRLLNARLDRELVRDAQLPHAYYELLVRLSEAPGRRLRMSQLADAADSSRSRLSHAVARLEEAGWVVREVCPTDRRGAVAQLTDAGFAALAAAAPGHADAVRTYVFDLLSPEQVSVLLAKRQADQVAAHVAAQRHRGTEGRTGPAEPVPTTAQRRILLRRQLNALVAAHHHRTSLPHGKIHAELRRLCGGPPSAQATIEQLEERIAALQTL